jgi:hypothetical protein
MYFLQEKSGDCVIFQPILSSNFVNFARDVLKTVQIDGHRMCVIVELKI